MEADKDAVTISIEDEDLRPQKQRTAGFTPDVDDEDSLNTDDKAEVRPRLLFSDKNNYFL